MRHDHLARVSATVASAVALAAGVMLVGATNAQAVSSVWGCYSLIQVSPGTVYGTTCSPHGGGLTGVGYVFLEPDGIDGYRCTSFSPVLISDNNYQLTGNGCVVHSS